MPFDKIDIDNITEERRKSVAKSIRAASIEELKKLSDEVFHDLDELSMNSTWPISNFTSEECSDCM